MRHLTWRGRLSVVYYALRRLFISPACADDRCFMGAPIGEYVRCPREAVEDEFWCRHHARRVAG